MILLLQSLMFVRRAVTLEKLLQYYSFRRSMYNPPLPVADFLRVAIICLSPAHPALRDRTVTSVKFPPNLVSQVVSKGKRKRGQLHIQPNTIICTITCSDSSAYIIRACVPGYLFEYNEALTRDPSALMLKVPFLLASIILYGLIQYSLAASIRWLLNHQQTDSKAAPTDLVAVDEYLSRRAGVIVSRSPFDFGTDPFPHLGLSAVGVEAAAAAAATTASDVAAASAVDDAVAIAPADIAAAADVAPTADAEGADSAAGHQSADNMV